MKDNTQTGAGLISARRQEYGDETNSIPSASILSNPNMFTSNVQGMVRNGALLAHQIDAHRLEFQKACNEITQRDFGCDCFDDMDAYGLDKVVWIGRAPAEFVADHLAQDYEDIYGGVPDSCAGPWSENTYEGKEVKDGDQT